MERRLATTTRQTPVGDSENWITNSNASGAVLSTYSDLVVDAPEDLLDRARAADLFALVELASRAGQNLVATAAEGLLRTIVRHG